LSAVRKGKWKLHFSTLDTYNLDWELRKIKWITHENPLLYNIEVDPSEKYDIAAEHPDIVAELVAIARKYNEEIRRNGENQELIDWFVNEWDTSDRRPIEGQQW